MQVFSLDLQKLQNPLLTGALCRAKILPSAKMEKSTADTRHRERGQVKAPHEARTERTLRSCKLNPRGAVGEPCYSRYRVSVSMVNAKRGHTACMTI